MTEEELATILAQSETPGTEFKGPGRLSEKPFAAQIVKAIIGMSNHRDGGRIIVGVKEEAGKPVPIGLGDIELATWKRDDLADKVSGYAEPAPIFDMEVVTYKGSRYISIEVQEFSDIPVICKKGYSDILHEGAIYSRPRRKPETIRIRAQEDMRDLLDIATDKKLRQFLARAQRVGITPNAADQDYFAKQTLEFENRPKAVDLRSKAYWKLIVRPTVFNVDRFTKIGDLERIVKASAIELQGWKLPSSLFYDRLVRGEDHVSNVHTHDGPIQESWSLYQSGQFIYYHIMRDNHQISQPGPVLSAGLGVIWPTLMFQFAGRFAETAIEQGEIYIEIEAGNINGWRLEFEFPFIAFGDFVCNARKYPFRKVVSKTDLLVGARELALEPSRELLGRFGSDPDERWMRDIQSKYL